MVTHGTTGDVLPFVRLAAALRDRGHEPLLITHRPYAAHARRAGVEFAPIDTAAAYAEHLSRTPDLLRVRSPADLRAFYDQSHLFEQLRVECDVMARAHRPGDTLLVGRHGSALSVLIAADLLGAPAALVALSPSQLITSAITEFLIGAGLGAEISRVRAGYGLDPVTDRSGWFGPGGRTLALWPEWFDAAGPPAPPGTRMAGFVDGDELGFRGPTGRIPDAGRALFAGPEPPVLVTGGTGRALHDEFYPVAVAAAAELGRPALVVTPHRPLLPDPLPDGVTWLPAVPFAQVLPRCAAIVHHGGIGTAARALRAGTPQVILAHGLDRADNASRLAGLRLARWAPPRDWTTSGIAALIGQAVADVGYWDRAMTACAADDPERAARTAAGALENLLASDAAEEVLR